MRHLMAALSGKNSWTCTICWTQQTGATCSNCGWWLR